MVSFTGYEPDPDITDEIGYGWFTDPAGSRQYGYDPEEAKRLQEQMRANDQRTAQLSDPDLYASEINQQLGRGRTVADVPAPVPGMEQPLPPAAQQAAVQPVVGPANAAQAQSALFDLPDNTRAAVMREAQRSGLDPEKMARVIKLESGGDTNIASKTGDHAGLIQFSRNWFKDDESNLAERAGLGRMSWDDMRDLDPDKQMRLVGQYFKDRGITGDSELGDYYLSVAASGHVKSPDDRVVYGQGSKAVSMNPIWDRDKDGQVTAGELRRVLGPAGAQAAAQSAPPLNVPEAGAMRGAPGGMQLPQVPGMLPAQVTMAGGVPMSDEELQARQRQVMDSTFSQMAQVQAGAQGRIQGRQDAMQEVQANHEQYTKNLEYRQQHDNALRNVAQQQIQQELAVPIQKVDPLRVIKDASAGDMILGFIGILLESGFAGARGAPIPDTLGRIIDQDVASQKDALDRGERTRNNRVAHWTRVLNDAQAGVNAATAELNISTARRIERLAQTKIENADIQAQAMQASQQLADLGQQRIQAIIDQRTQRLSVTYAPPAPPPQAELGPVPVVSADQNGRTVDPVEQHETVRRAALISPEWRQLERGQQAKLVQDFAGDMGNVEEMKRARDRLRSLYNVTPDAQGRYPEDGDYGSAATGPWWNPADLSPLTTERDRALEKAWGIVRLAERMGWKTEPNNKAAQELFQNLNKPDRDTDVPTVMQQLDQKIAELERRIKGGAMPGARAFYYGQNVAAPDVRPVTGLVR